MSVAIGNGHSGGGRLRCALAALILVVSAPALSIAADGQLGITLEPAPPRFGFKPVEPGSSFRSGETTRRQTEIQTQSETPPGVVQKIPTAPERRSAATVMSPPGRAERLPDVTTFGRTPIATRSGSIAGTRGPSRGIRAPRARR